MKDVLSYFIGGLSAAMVVYLIVWVVTPALDPAKTAYESYLAGEKASTVGERKDKFNEALAGYKKIESETNPERGNGVLYYDIGNSYFQLEEYPLAIYYYYKALKLSPGNADIIHNLNVGLTKLQLPSVQEPSWFHRVLMLGGFSLPHRLQMFAITTILTIIALSLFFWFKDRRAFNASVILGILTLYLFLNTAYESYLVPVEGVVVSASSLYRDAGEQYAKVSEDYLSPGLKVEVLDQREKGRWLKILTPAGQLGYVASDSLRLL